MSDWRYNFFPQKDMESEQAKWRQWQNEAVSPKPTIRKRLKWWVISVLVALVLIALFIAFIH